MSDTCIWEELFSLLSLFANSSEEPSHTKDRALWSAFQLKCDLRNLPILTACPLQFLSLGLKNYRHCSSHRNQKDSVENTQMTIMEDPSTQRWVLSEICSHHTSPCFSIGEYMQISTGILSQKRNSWIFDIWLPWLFDYYEFIYYFKTRKLPFNSFFVHTKWLVVVAFFIHWEVKYYWEQGFFLFPFWHNKPIRTKIFKIMIDI